MTPYDKAAELAIEVSKMVKSYSDIATFFPAIFWLSELYREMAERDEITKIQDVKSSYKLVIWTSVCQAAPERPKWIKILAARACYLWDLIIQNEQGNNIAI